MADNSLYSACHKGNKDVAQKSLSFNSAKYVHPTHGYTPLHQACKQGWLDIVRILIEKYNCDPSMATTKGLLHGVCGYGHTDIAEYLIKEQHLDPLVRDDNKLEPLDYAIKHNKTDTVVYLCQHCISSDEILNPKRIKTTINLIKYIASRPLHPKWKTANGDNILQLVESSEICISHIPSAVILEILNSHDSKYNILNCVEAKPEWKTANGDTLLQLVCRSKITVSQTSSTVLMKWLSSTTCTTLKIVKPEWKTADGVTLFQLICQSEKCLKQISSQIFLMWLWKTPLEFVSVPMPDCETADGYTLLQLILHSEMTLSRTSSMVLSKLLDYSRDLPINQMKKANPNWKTLDGVQFVYALFLSKVEDTNIIELMQHYILKNDLNPDNTYLGNTALHIACLANKLAVVSYLINQAHCDPNIKNKTGSLPLDMTKDPKIINFLCQHDHVAVYSKTIIEWVEKHKSCSINDATMLYMLKSLVNNHKYNTKDGSTLLHVLCMHGFSCANKIVFLLNECHCDPNCLDSNGQTPLQVTSDSKIMTELIEHGAIMTPDVVFKLITSTEVDSTIKEILTLSIKKQAILCPNELNSDGYTALHLACKADNPTRVNILLSKAHCDPNVKSSNEEVALQMTTNPEIITDLIRHGAKTSIMYESYQQFLGTNKPVQPPVKVFIVGNPSVGKSTLTAALQKRTGIFARFFSGKVTGVDQKTVGIVPHDLENDTFGKVTLYDFAGHREFYSGHAALLQTAIQSTPPVFLLVVNLCEQEHKIIKNILYWISFLENQCASVSCKPHIILVGSHADILKGTNPIDKVKIITNSLEKNNYWFTNMKYVGFVAMNCQYHESTGMSDLRHLLIKSCGELRIQEPITFNAHCFLVFLIDEFMDLTAVQIKTISERIDNHLSEGGILEFLPKGIEMLYKICLELNDRGHILLLKDRIAIQNSYIVIDKKFLLSKIYGTVFAPEGFKQYKELSTNTGVVSLSKIEECFPDKDLDILIGFLIHLEFCHEISDQALHQLISEQYSQGSSERYYLFPGLISLKADDTVWKLESKYNYNFRWVLKCTHPEQFFSSRFLQVLLLRLAFSFALETPHDNPIQGIGDNPNQSIGIHRNCCLWKNGISWGSVFGMQTLVEVTPDNKSVVLLARFQETNLLLCVKHRSEVISTILQCKNQFCPRLLVVEIFIDSSSPLQHVLNLCNEGTVCTLQDLATAIVCDCECPSIVIQSNTIPAKDFLSFEPYLEMNISIVQQLCDEKTKNYVISERLLSLFAQYAQSSEKTTLGLLVGNVMTANGMKDDQIYQQLLKWRDSDMDNQKTYHDLWQLVDQYSVFVGRNVLKLAKQENLQSSQILADEENERKQVSNLIIVQDERPIIHELQMLEFSDGRVLRIMESVAPQWKQMAVALGFSVARIKSIEKGEHYKPGDASFEIFSCWLEGEHDLKPPTWDALIQCLKQANLLDMAEMLSNLQIIKEDDNESLTARNRTNSEGVSVTATNQDCGVLQRDHGDSLPNLDIKALEVTEGHGGRRVRVIESIGPQWEEVAKALDMEQEDIDMIQTRHSDNDEEACCEMLTTWLEGNNGEVSWTAFSQALIDAGLPELADNLQNILGL